MIRRSPAENYFKYLVVHPGCYDNKYIKSVADELKLDYLGEWYISWLRERMRPPPQFRPDDLRHTRSQRFLLKEGLEKVFRPNRAMAQAIKILDQPRWREVVETMLLSRAPLPATVHALRVRYKAVVTEDALRLFKHFFWNIDLIDSVEMRALLDMRHNGLLASPDAETQAQFSSIRRMRHTDPRVVAARLPNSPLAAMIAQMEVGVLPRKVDLASVVKRTMEVAALRAFDAVSTGGPNGAQMAQGFALVADVMNRLQASVVNPEEQLRSDLERISIATTTKTVPTMRQLTAGNHTTNVHPDPKPDQEVIEADFESEDDDDEQG